MRQKAKFRADGGPARGRDRLSFLADFLTAISHKHASFSFMGLTYCSGIVTNNFAASQTLTVVGYLDAVSLLGV